MLSGCQDLWGPKNPSTYQSRASGCSSNVIMAAVLGRARSRAAGNALPARQMLLCLPLL
jgi:hypothetical protein